MEYKKEKWREEKQAKKEPLYTPKDLFPTI